MPGRMRRATFSRTYDTDTGEPRNTPRRSASWPIAVFTAAGSFRNGLIVTSIRSLRVSRSHTPATRPSITTVGENHPAARETSASRSGGMTASRGSDATT